MTPTPKERRAAEEARQPAIPIANKWIICECGHRATWLEQRQMWMCARGHAYVEGLNDKNPSSIEDGSTYTRATRLYRATEYDRGNPTPEGQHTGESGDYWTNEEWLPPHSPTTPGNRKTTSDPTPEERAMRHEHPEWERPRVTSDPTPEDYERARAVLHGWAWSVDGSNPIESVARAIAAARAEERELAARRVESLPCDTTEHDEHSWDLSRPVFAAAIRDRAKQEQES